MIESFYRYVRLHYSVYNRFRKIEKKNDINVIIQIMERKSSRNRSSYQSLQFGNKPYFLSVYRLISEHTGWWWNTRKVCKPRGAASWFTRGTLFFLIQICFYCLSLNQSFLGVLVKIYRENLKRLNLAKTSNKS